jgi:hypothetical protein
VRLAARGSRQLNENVEEIDNHAELKQVRRQALRVQAKALAAGLVVTVIVCLFP